MNAAKMERIFAKPFVAALEGHVDAVETMARRPGSLNVVASGSWDGGAWRIFFLPLEICSKQNHSGSFRFAEVVMM